MPASSLGSADFGRANILKHFLSAGEVSPRQRGEVNYTPLRQLPARIQPKCVYGAM